ncbi:MAG: hypothetical protein NUV80_00825 [Candidatus Berkelbacteria bacterium]|nr:hypothetical protein [Candidatus Berkelbacteria bacterium]
MKKKCSKCGEVKRQLEFYRDKRTKDGHYSACKSCHFSNKNIAESKKRWREKNKEKRREYMIEWRKKHAERLVEYNRNYQKKWRVDPKNKLDSNMKRMIWEVMKGQKARRRWCDLLGYTVEDLMKHLESKFEGWMTFENYGEWEIDHIKPKSLFKYETPEGPQFKECWALENLRPLEKSENRKKYNKLL